SQLPVRRCRSVRRPPCPRVTPAPCTPASPGSSLLQSGSHFPSRTRHGCSHPLSRGDDFASPVRSPAAWRPSPSTRCFPVLSPDERSLVMRLLQRSGNFNGVTQHFLGRQ